MNDTTIKSISAVKPKREGGHSRAKRKRGGENVRWKRLTDNFDELVKLGAHPGLIAPLPRLVFFKHLSTKQGMAGRRYADVVRKFERYHMAPMARNGKSVNLEPSSKSEDQELERHVHNGTMKEYEIEAKSARRSYARLTRVLGRFTDPITGRNIAKNVLDDLCLSDKEPPAEYRSNIAAVLEAIAREFDVKEVRS